MFFCKPAEHTYVHACRAFHKAGFFCTFSPM